MKISLCLTLMTMTTEIRQHLNVMVHFLVTIIFPWIYLLHTFFPIVSETTTSSAYTLDHAYKPNSNSCSADQPKQSFSPTGPTSRFSIHPNAMPNASASLTSWKSEASWPFLDISKIFVRCWRTLISMPSLGPMSYFSSPNFTFFSSVHQATPALSFAEWECHICLD